MMVPSIRIRATYLPRPSVGAGLRIFRAARSQVPTAPPSRLGSSSSPSTASTACASTATSSPYGELSMSSRASHLRDSATADTSSLCCDSSSHFSCSRYSSDIFDLVSGSAADL